MDSVLSLSWILVHWALFIPYNHTFLLAGTSLPSVVCLRLEKTGSWRQKNPVGSKMESLGALRQVFSNKACKNGRFGSREELHIWIPPAWHHGLWSFQQLCNWRHRIQQNIPWDRTSSAYIGRTVLVPISSWICDVFWWVVWNFLPYFYSKTLLRQAFHGWLRHFPGEQISRSMVIANAAKNSVAAKILCFTVFVPTRQARNVGIRYCRTGNICVVTNIHFIRALCNAWIIDAANMSSPNTLCSLLFRRLLPLLY